MLPDPGEPSFCGRCGHLLERVSRGGRDRPQCPACGWTYFAKSGLGAAVVIEHEGQVLLVQRAHQPYQGWWTLPAGYVEYGEDVAETAAREALEETGLFVVLQDFLGIYFGGGDPRGAAHLAVYRAQQVGGQLRPGDDAADARWFAPEALPIEIAFEAQRKALSQWLAERKIVRLPSASPLLLFNGAGPAPPLLVYAVIENPRGSMDRIVYNHERSTFVRAEDRFASPLPVDYGFIPRTHCPGDGDELDVAILAEGEVNVGSVWPVRPIGAMLREDGDHKVIAVRVDLPSAYSSIMDVRELPELQGVIAAWSEIRGRVSGWASASETRQLILEAQRAWIERTPG
jgi:8-oxo-dGTP diphosphatase